jgi:hypothetical protein
MRLLYQGPAIQGVADSVVVMICYGQRADTRFAEYHILFASHRGACKLAWLRLRTQEHEGLLSREQFVELALSYANSAVQRCVDKQYVGSGSSAQFTLRPCDDSMLRRLHYAGLCRQQLHAIARQTWCQGTSAFLRNIDSLPEISATSMAEQQA